MEGARSEERLQELLDCGYVGRIQEFARSVCAPVFLRTTEGKLTQGSMTLLTGATGFLGVTAGHVADAVVAEGLKTCQLGAGPLDPASLIDRSRTLDLATFRLSHEVVAESRHLAFKVRSWPLPPLATGDLVLVGGYPGAYRVDSQRQFAVAFVYFVGPVQSVSENNLGLALGIKTSLCAGEERVPENADLGGCSGGPVFRLTETADAGGLYARFELVGVIYEYSPTWELLLAHPLTSLSADGRLDG